MLITLSNATGNAMLSEMLGRINAGGAGTIKIYTGAKPASPDVAITSQVLLATLTCSATAGTVANKALTFSAITQDAAADATGVATWARIDSGGATPVIDVDVGTTVSTAFLKMSTTSIVSGGPVLISSLVITI